MPCFDWTEELLKERIEAMLEANLIHENPATGIDVCVCAGNILSAYGIAFNQWINNLIIAGTLFDDIPEFDGVQVDLCQAGLFEEGTAEIIREFLTERYNAYRFVSYRLYVLVNLLSKLRNVYPGATLHDCDDGSDQNPVRLGSTSLGNYPMKRSLIEETPVEEPVVPVKPFKKKRIKVKPEALKTKTNEKTTKIIV